METIKHEDFVSLLTEYNYKHDIPGTGFFELTPLCNLDCKMCYVHLQDPALKERLLSGEQWIALMKDAIDHGMTRACLTGGEAMTHPDFLDIFMFLIGNGVEVQVKTNGLLLDGPRLEVFKKYPPIMIDVSLYGCDSESYLAVTGVDAYERIVSNIQKAISEKLHLRIMITPSECMAPWIENVMRLANSFHVSVMISDFLIDPNEETGRNKKDFDLSLTQYEQIKKLKNEIFDPNDIKKDEYEPDDEMESAPAPQKKGLTCLAGRAMFTINWDGTMSPCVSFPRNIVLAEPLKTGFGSAWKKINEAVKEYELPEKCHECEIRTRCKFCPVKHSQTAHLHRCDDAVCDFMMNKFKRKNA